MTDLKKAIELKKKAYSQKARNTRKNEIDGYNDALDDAIEVIMRVEQDYQQGTECYYYNLQRSLSLLLRRECNPRIVKLQGNRLDGYREGVLLVKSIAHGERRCGKLI